VAPLVLSADETAGAEKAWSIGGGVFFFLSIDASTLALLLPSLVRLGAEGSTARIGLDLSFFIIPRSAEKWLQ
jgi:hypothetical protein